MDAFKRYAYHLLALSAFGALILAGTQTRLSRINGADALPRVETSGVALHSLDFFHHHELAPLMLHAQVDLRPYILQTVEQSLPQAYKKHAFEIAHAVIAEANHHGMDPFFLLAVIKTESHFNVQARGSHGEIGLMQIRPQTAAWLAPQAGLSSKFDLEDPSVNIRIGATYFAYLRLKFQGHANRYVGAYNMGVKNVRRLVASNIEPTIYAGKVIGNYKGFYHQLKSVMNLPARQVASVAGDQNM
jgi:soluble lytic murein transglycosylase-like protein